MVLRMGIHVSSQAATTPGALSQQSPTQHLSHLSSARTPFQQGRRGRNGQPLSARRDRLRGKCSRGGQQRPRPSRPLERRHCPNRPGDSRTGTLFRILASEAYRHQSVTLGFTSSSSHVIQPPTLRPLPYPSFIFKRQGLENQLACWCQQRQQVTRP